jgi:hypothetical protein
MNFGSCASYRHCAAGAHFPECRKMPPIREWEMDLVLMTKSVEINSNRNHASSSTVNGSVCDASMQWHQVKKVCHRSS